MYTTTPNTMVSHPKPSLQIIDSLSIYFFTVTSCH